MKRKNPWTTKEIEDICYPLTQFLGYWWKRLQRQGSWGRMLLGRPQRRGWSSVICCMALLADPPSILLGAPRAAPLLLSACLVARGQPPSLSNIYIYVHTYVYTDTILVVRSAPLYKYWKPQRIRFFRFAVWFVFPYLHGAMTCDKYIRDSAELWQNKYSKNPDELCGYLA